MNINLLTFDTIDSTNTEALKQARFGAEEGLCIVARQQTAGRGRHGRRWVSEKDSGLYFSIVLRPKIETQYLPLITLMTGVAVHETLAYFGIAADIKWVNDLLVNEKKICGILAETTETQIGLAVVVGIGINVKSSNFPPDLAETATSIEAVLSEPPASRGRGVRSLTVREGSAEYGSIRPSPEPPVPTRSFPSLTFAEARTTLIETLTENVVHFYNTVSSPDGPSRIIDEWGLRSSYFSGKRVRVALENEIVTGTTDGLEPNGALRLRRDDGSLIIVQAGDVQRLRSEHASAET